MPYEQGIILKMAEMLPTPAMIRSLSLPNEKAHIFVPETIRDEAETLVREWVKPSQSSLSAF